MPRATTKSREPATEVRTFLFADLRGYTRFTHERGDEAAATLVTKLVLLARRRIEARGGKVVEVRGDEVMAAFPSARQALRTAVELQENLQSETRREPSLPLSVGMGLDAGDAVVVGSGYRGGALNLAARLCSLAGPGEVLATEAVVHLARRTEGLQYSERGLVQFKGLSEPIRVIEVTTEAPASSPSSADQALQQTAPHSGTEAPASPLPTDAADQVQGATPRSDGASTRSERAKLPIGSFIGALPEGLLVARDAELATILQSLEEVSNGAGRLILLAGEPGIGKTRLAQEASLAARNRDFLVATGRCYESDAAVPFFPFIEALGMAFADAPPALKAEVPHRWPGMGRLLPTAWEGAGSASSDGDEEQQRLFWAVTGFLQAIAVGQPVALFLDDIHWADNSSLRLLQHLARHSRADRIFLFGTYRDVEVDRRHPLDRALLDLHRERLLTRVPVGRFDRAGTAALIAVTLGTDEAEDELVEIVHPHTDGNPFFVQEVLRALVERGDIYRDADTWRRRGSVDIVVPENVRSVIRQRLARLSPEGQEILHEASVIGQTFNFNHLQRLGSRPEEAVEEALDESVAAGLIRESGGDEYAFNHTLTHGALYSEISGHKRRRLHLMVAGLLKQTVESRSNRQVADLAWHFIEGGDAQQALPYVMRAGDGAAAIFAHAEAEYRYRTGVRLALEIHDGLREREALEKLGGVLRTTARYDEAFEALDRAAALYHEAGDLEGEGRVTAQIGVVHHVAGTPAQGIERITSFLASLDDPDAVLPRIGPSLFVGLASLHMLNGNNTDSLAAGTRAWDLARKADDDRMLAEVGVARGTALFLLGQTEDALAVLDETVRRAEAADDTEALSLSLDGLSEICMSRGELERCRSYREQALVLFERMGDPAKIAYGLCMLGSVRFYLGDWTEARALFTRAMDQVERTESSWVRAHPSIGLGMCSLGKGDMEAARRHLQTCIEISERTRSPETLTYGQRLMADCDLLEGNPAGAVQRLEPLLHHPGLARDNVPRVLSALAQARLDLGDEKGAVTAIDEAETLAEGATGRLAMVDVLRVCGLIAARQGRHTEAEQAFENAAHLARDMPFPYAEACALRACGQLSLQKGSVDDAVAHLEAALRIFHRLGAERDAALTHPIVPQH
jgi:class 3 adenylate cyclase/tetratricopeptide (TPR) repeat protein